MSWPDVEATTLSGAILTGVGMGEIGLLCLAGLAFFMKQGNTLAEAAAYALMVPLMALSFLFQLAFIVGLAPFAPVAELGLCAVAAGVLWTSRPHLATACKIAGEFIAAHRLPAWLFLVFGGYLVAAATVSAPPPGSRGMLSQILSWHSAGAIVSGDLPLPPVPINAAVLPYLFLRFGSYSGVGLLGLMAYMAIGCATYALARRHSWPPTAFTVTLVTISLPRLVYLATSAGLEIVPAAAAVFCLVALYRLVERPAALDLFLLILGIFFCMPPEKVCYALPAVLTLLSVILLVRRHGVHIWSRMIRSHPWAALSLVPPVLIFSQVWLFAANLSRTGSWTGAGSSQGLFFNPDGLQGAFANLLRYLLESAHFTAPADRLCYAITGFRLSSFLQGLYDHLGAPLFDGLGGAVPFTISWAPHGPGVWFGPFGFILVIPALGYALIRGSRRLKAISLALIGYVYFICLVCAWTPENARLFTPVFASGGFCAAFLLPPWRFSLAGKRSIQAMSLLLLAYAAVAYSG